MKFFTSDIHFSDENTFKVDNRPFKNVKKYNQFVIKQFNKVAKKDDIIYVIGDSIDCDNEKSNQFFEALKYVKKIKANVILIIGNNEERAIKYFFNNDFEKFKKHCIDLGYKDVLKDCYLSFGGYNFYLTHKPKDFKSDYFNLFGHVHRGSGIYKSFGLNVGTDLNHFRPYSENDILELIKFKSKYWDNDDDINIR